MSSRAHLRADFFWTSGIIHLMMGSRAFQPDTNLYSLVNNISAKFKSISNLEHPLLIHFEMSLFYSKHLWRMCQQAQGSETREVVPHGQQKCPVKCPVDYLITCEVTVFLLSSHFLRHLLSELWTLNHVGGKPPSSRPDLQVNPFRWQTIEERSGRCPEVHCQSRVCSLGHPPRFLLFLFW